MFSFNFFYYSKYSIYKIHIHFLKFLDNGTHANCIDAEEAKK